MEVAEIVASDAPVDRDLPSIEDTLGSGGLLSGALPGFEHRDGQLAMARAIEEKIRRGGHLVVEAPTGIGKTLGYLVPALRSGRRVIVSTNTKNLQDQIATKDLPLLARALKAAGVDLVPAEAYDPLSGEGGAAQRSFALMKGRANYLCLERLDKKRGQQSFDFDFDLLGEIAAWARATTAGDRAELVHLPEQSPLWSELDARSERCLGSRCARYDDCFVVRMRQNAERADLIVVNHHLLFADLSLKARARLTHGRRFGEVVPTADVLIIDEAHAIEEISSEYFGGSVSSGKLERLAADLGSRLAEGMEGVDRLTVDAHLQTAVARTEAVFAALPSSETRLRVPPGGGGPLQAARLRLPSALRALQELIESLTPAVDLDPAAANLADRTAELAESLRFVLQAEDSDYVYWTERRGRRAVLGASPVNVAHLLESHLFGAFETVITTSATLAAHRSSCAYFRTTVGVPEAAEEMVLDSPFDFAAQAALYLPKDAPDPTHPEAPEQLAEIGRALIELVGGGALFLFTSYRVMHAVHEALATVLDHPVLIQGEQPRQRLLQRFVDEAPAVLFATASFWEGVDVPGDPLRLVMIDRLPFDAPNDPLIAARSERSPNAFAEVSLPRAILRLKQGFGRLVRHRQDRGVVAVLDRRLQTKGYGRRFLEALPGARHVDELEALERWWCGTDSQS